MTSTSMQSGRWSYQDRRAAVIFVIHATMAGVAFEVWRRYDDFNTGFFLALSGIALMALFISFVDVEPESRKQVGGFVYRILKSLVTIAFLSAVVMFIRLAHTAG